MNKHTATPAAVDVLAVMDKAAETFASMGGLNPVQGQAIAQARVAVAELVAASLLVTGGHDMATVKGRMEMQRRLNVLARALAKLGGAA